MTELVRLHRFYEAEESQQEFVSKNPKDAYCTRNLPKLLEKIRESEFYSPTASDMDLN